MSFYEYETFKLPTIDFIGGEQQDMEFALFDKQQEPFLVVGYSAEFAVQSYSNPSGAALITKAMSVPSRSGVMSCSFTVSLSASDTVNLNGKYIYQITIKNASSTPVILAQGIMYVVNNIDPSYAVT